MAITFRQFNVDERANVIQDAPLYEVIIGSVGQTVVNLTGQYNPGSMSLEVFKDGHLLVNNIDYEETTPDSITLLVPLETETRLVLRTKGVTSSREEVISTDKQVNFTLQKPYSIGKNQLMVFRNGVLQIVDVDYIEESNWNVKFNTELDEGERVTFIQVATSIV